MQKYFKIFIKIIFYSILFLLLIYSTAFVALQTKYVQNIVGKQVVRILSYFFETNIKVDKIHYPFFNRINIKNICIYDKNGDTLLFSEKLNTNFKFNFGKKEFTITKFIFENSFINFIIDTNNVLNLEYFIEKLSKKKENPTLNKTSISFIIKDIKILNSKFYLTNLKNKSFENDSIIDFSELKLKDLNIELKDFDIGDSVGFFIKKLSFIEKSGFKLNDLSCNFKIYKRFLKFNNIKIITEKSLLNIDRVYLLFNNFQDFKADRLFNNVNLSIQIDYSKLSFIDLSYFVKFLKNSNQQVNISGNFYGTLNMFRAKNIYLSTGKNTTLNMNFIIDGLPDFEKMFAFVDVKKLITNFNDIVSFDFPGKKVIKVPNFLRDAGNISFKGQFTGFYNDFVTYGYLKSNFGLIKTDMLLKPKNKEEISFSGLLKTEDYDIGKLLKYHDLGKFSFEINTIGTSRNLKTFDALLDGKIKFVEYKNYIYSNINILGSLKNKIFSGKVDIEDNNIDFNVEGIFDFNKNNINYNLSSEIKYLNLYKLNIDKKIKDQILSLKFKSILEGNSINTLNGYMKIYDFKIRKPNNLLIIDDITLQINNNGKNSIKLNSDLLNTNIEGNFKIDELWNNLLYFLNKFFPSFIAGNKINLVNSNLSRCTFDFNVDIIDLQSFIDYLDKDIYISSGAILKGKFSYDENIFTTRFFIPSFAIGNKFFKNINLEIANNKDSLNYNINIDKSDILKNISIGNLSFSGSIFNDTLIGLIKWYNLNYNLSSGYMPLVTSFSRNNKSDLIVKVDLINSYLVLNNKLWNISFANLEFGKSFVCLSDFIISYGNQTIKANGNLSEQEDNKIEIDVKNFDLKNLSEFISIKNMDGTLNGNLKFSGTLSKPVLDASLTIDSLFYNQEKLGKINLITNWNNEDKKLSFKTTLERGTLKTIDVDGKFYSEQGGKLDIDILLDKLRLETFVPYNDIFNNTKGFVNGKVKVEGNFKKPIFKGNLNCQRVIFEFIPLKTVYTFTDNLKIDNNVIKFEDFSLIDRNGNKGKINGIIDLNNLKNININLNFNVNNFHVLNTNYLDNNSFFGEVYATGFANVQGTPKNLNIDIKARTESNTKFYIYLEDKENLTGYDYVVFLKDNELKSVENLLENDLQIRKIGIDINIDADVTPEAEIQIVFNPLTGDVIKGKGNGNLNIQLFKEKFNIYGVYVLESGDYSFNLLDVINRKFTLKDGSTISFNGNPMDANINILAFYRTRASLGDLFGNVEEVQQKTTVDCQIIMTGKLRQPTIRYDIYLPNVEESTRDNVKSKINTNEELIKQFTSLLILNRFVPSMTSATENNSNSLSPYVYIAGINPGDLITSQLSNWLSQLNEDFNIGVNLRSNRQLKTEEIEFILSTQLLNDRLSIQGNVDVPTNATAKASNRIVGDVEIEYKITKTGKLRAKAFNKSNEDQLNILSPYTQGIGIVYREEFDSPLELFTRIFKRKKEIKK